MWEAKSDLSGGAWRNSAAWEKRRWLLEIMTVKRFRKFVCAQHFRQFICKLKKIYLPTVQYIQLKSENVIQVHDTDASILKVTNLYYGPYRQLEHFLQVRTLFLRIIYPTFSFCAVRHTLAQKCTISSLDSTSSIERLRYVLPPLWTSTRCARR